MADQSHVDWLREGVEAWNARRASNDFDPDLSGVKLDSLPDLQGCNLEKANLQDAVLIGVDLSESNLANADLRNVSAWNARFYNAILYGANLQQADLMGVDFSSAILQRADLTKARLTLADLSDADIRFAAVADARLETTILSRTNTLSAKLWQAVLYEESGGAVNPNSQGEETAIESVSNMLDEIHKLDAGAPLYFRGEQRCGWQPTPSVFRERLSDVEDKILIDLMARRPQEMSDARTALEQLQIAQHYGLSTRLLDVTKNPLVALFFACEEDQRYDCEDGRLLIFSFPESLVKPFNSDTVSVIANFAKLQSLDKRWLLSRDGLHPQRPFSAQYNYGAVMGRLYQKVREEKPHFEERIDMKDLYGVFVVEPQQKDERIRAQSSAFLVSAFREQFDFEQSADWNGAVRPYEHYSLRVRSGSKESILNDLKLMGITRQTLFPGLESSATEVMRRYRALPEKPLPTRKVLISPEKSDPQQNLPRTPVLINQQRVATRPERGALTYTETCKVDTAKVVIPPKRKQR